VNSPAILALAHFRCRWGLYSGSESLREMTHRGVINLGRDARTGTRRAERNSDPDGSRSDHDTGKPAGGLLGVPPAGDGHTVSTADTIAGLPISLGKAGPWRLRLPFGASDALTLFASAGSSSSSCRRSWRHILGEAVGSLRFSGISGWRLVVPRVGGWPVVLPCR
jgi:hypothetical protein